MTKTTTDLNQVPGKLYYICGKSVCNITCLMKQQISLKSNKVSSKSTEQFRRNCTYEFAWTDGRTDRVIPIYPQTLFAEEYKMIAHFSLYEIIMIIYKLIKKIFHWGH